MNQEQIDEMAKKALEHLKRGQLKLGKDWEAAHEICQSFEGVELHDRIHALCHRIEGDFGNAAYWDRRGNQESPSEGLEAEWLGLSNSV